MKQLLQNLKTGHTELIDVPTPQSAPGHLLINTAISLISAGTERMDRLRNNLSHSVGQAFLPVSPDKNVWATLFLK